MKTTRIILLSAFPLLFATSVVMAAPVTFSGSGSSSVALSSFTWGTTLDVPIIGDVTVGQWSSLSATLNPALESQSFTINEGEYKEIEFFTLRYDGVGYGTYNIDATLAFDNQSITTAVAGEGSWGSINWNIPYFYNPFTGQTSYFSGGINGGKLDWDSNSIDFLLPETWVLDYYTNEFLTDLWDPFDLGDNYQLIDNNMIGIFFEDGLDFGFSDTLTVHAYILNFGELPPNPSPVPEPSNILLLWSGLLALGVSRSACKRKAWCR